MVPGEGIEPSIEDPKSSALPLGHPGATVTTVARRSWRSGECDLSLAPAFGMGMKAVVFGALLLLTTACGAYQFPTLPGVHTGTVSGRVLFFPCGPVEPAGGKCIGNPAAGVEIDFVEGTAADATVTDQNGNYLIQLRPATYQVQFKKIMQFVRGPKTVTVTADTNVVANYFIDSGIRVPVPQQ